MALTKFQVKQINRNNNELLKLNDKKTLIFPFVFSNGATNRTNQAFGQFGMLRRLFDGKNAVLVRWLNSRKPPKTINDKVTLEFQEGVAFEGYNYSHQLFNLFQKDAVTDTIELLNYKTLKIVLNEKQINDWFGKSFASFFSLENIEINASVDDTWLSILYYIPELSNVDIFYIESATLIKDLTGKIVNCEVNLRSLTHELRQSGRSVEQWVNFATPGDKYAIPVLDNSIAKKWKMEVKETEGFKFVQIEADNLICVNSNLLTGRPINTTNKALIEIPRELGISNVINPIFNTARKTNYYVKEWVMVTGQFINDFYDAGATPELIRNLERSYNPLQKRQATAFFQIDTISDSSGLVNNLKRKLNWENWNTEQVVNFLLPVRFFQSIKSSDIYKFKIDGTGKSVPDWTTAIAIKSFIDFLNLNSFSFQQNNSFTMGSKIYSQNALGIFGNLISTLVTGASAGIGTFLGAKAGNPLAGAAIGGFIGQGVAKIVDSFIKPWSTNTKIENANDFKWSFLMPKVLVDKMYKIFSSYKIPLSLFTGEKNELTALGVGKLPVVLTFQVSDILANTGNKTTLDLVSKNSTLDIKTNYKFEPTLKTYALDFWRLVALGMADVRLSLFDKNKNLIYTHYQATQAKHSEILPEVATESVISDLEAVTNELPIGYSNIKDPKIVPTNFEPTLTKQALSDVEVMFPVKYGLGNIYRENLRFGGSVVYSRQQIPWFYKIIVLKSNYNLRTIFANNPTFKIKFNYQFSITGSNSFTKLDPSGAVVSLPVINSMFLQKEFIIDKNNFNDTSKPFNGDQFSTTSYPAKQIKLIRKSDTLASDTIGYCQGEIGFIWTEEIQLINDNTIALKLYRFQAVNKYKNGFNNKYYPWKLSNFSSNLPYSSVYEIGNYIFNFNINNISVKTEV